MDYKQTRELYFTSMKQWNFQLQRILTTIECWRAVFPHIAETCDAEAVFVEWIKEAVLSFR